MKEEVGAALNIAEIKKTSRTFADGRERDGKGRYGKDEAFNTLTPPKPFLRYEFDLGFGEYKFGSIKLDVGSSNFNFNFLTKSEDIQRNKINKKFSELTEGAGFSPELVSSLKATLERTGCNIDSILIKETVLEGPGASLGINLSQQRIGARANAQIGAFSVILDTPLGEVIVKLKRGLGMGAEFGTISTKDGRPGVLKEKKVSFGTWEVILRNKDHSELIQVKGLESTAEQIVVETPQNRAKEFVAKQEKKKILLEVTNTSESIAATPSTKHENEQYDLLDQTVEQTVSSLGNDVHILSLHQSYKENDHRPDAFAKFQQALGEHLSSEARIQEWFAAGTAANIFLSEVAALTKNKTIKQFATGLSAMTQTFRGIHEISNATKLLSLPNGGLSLTAVTGLLGGAGLILGGFSAFRSLMDDNDELGEALSEIYGAITGMWTEMRENFQATWKMLEVVDKKLDIIHEQLETVNEKLDIVDSKLNIMEFNNHERFLLLVNQIEDIYSGLKQKLQNQNAQVDELKTTITSYLELLADNPLRVTLSNIKKTKREVLPIKIQEYTSILAQWLLNAAAISARTGELLILHGQRQVDQHVLIKMLREAIAPENIEKLNLPLGLYKSLSVESLGHTVQNLKVINPQGWFEVFDIYCKLLVIGAQTIVQEPEEVQKAYSEELIHIAIIIESITKFLELFSGSVALWEKLVQDYQKHFDYLKNEIEKEMRSLPIKPTQAPKVIGLNATITQIVVGKDGSVYAVGIDNTVYRTPVYHSNGSNNNWQIFTVLRRISIASNGIVWGIDRNSDTVWWVQTPTHYGEVPSLRFKEIAISPTGEIWGVSMADAICCCNNGNLNYIQISNDKTEKFKFISIGGNNDIWVINFDNIVYRRKDSHWERVHGVHLKQLSVGPNGEVWGIGMDDYIYHYLSASNSWDKIHRQYKYIAVGINGELWCINNDGRIHVLNSQLEGIVAAEAFEAQTLVPQRKAIAQRLNVFTEGLRASYLKLIAFIKLLDPCFNPKLEPATLSRLNNAISTLAQYGSAVHLSSLYDVVQKGAPREYASGTLRSQIWQEELWHYMGPNLVEFSINDLIKRFTERLPSHPLYQKLIKAKIQIDKLKKELDPALNRTAFEHKLKLASYHIAEQQVIIDKSLKDLLDSITHIASIINNSDLADLQESIKSLAAQMQSFKDSNRIIKFSKDNEEALDSKGALEILASKNIHQSLSTDNSTIEGLSYLPVPGDGHCLYTAVHYYLEKEEQHELREKVAAHIEQNLEDFREFIALSNGRTVEEYISDVRNGIEWASHVEIEILMRCLNRPIIVIEAGNNVINAEDAERFNGDPIFVHYNGHNHYDAYLLKDEFDSCSILQLLLNKSTNEDCANSIQPQLAQFNERSLTNFKEVIQQLCTMPNVSIKEIETELIRLESHNSLDKSLNQGDIASRPLQLAISVGRPDIVALLLEYGAKLEDSTIQKSLSNCANPKAARKIRALVHFYRYIQQQSLEEDFAMGRTLGLIRTSIKNLSAFHDLDDAIILIGKTGAGKSTLANCLAGVEYELVFEEDGSEHLRRVGEIGEQAQTSFYSGSETYYPQILTLDNNNYNLVDMPGFRDTRGTPWNIAGGLSTQMLGYSFKTVRALVLVCLDTDLYDKRIEGVRDSFEMLGNIISQRPELMQNVLLIINNATAGRMRIGANGILKRIKFILEDKDLSESAKFALQCLTEDHIVVTDVPCKDYQELIFARIGNYKSKAFNDFNFSCYHKEAEKFKTLIMRLGNYQQQVQDELNGLTALIMQSQQEAIAQVNRILNSKEFVFKIEAAIGPKDLMEKKQALEEIFVVQESLLYRLVSLIEKLEEYIKANYLPTDLSEIIFSADILEETLERQERLAIIKEFFDKIQTVIEYLKLEQAMYAPQSGNIIPFAKTQQFWLQPSVNHDEKDSVDNDDIEVDMSKTQQLMK